MFQRLNGNLLAVGAATINTPVMPQGSDSFTTFTLSANTTGAVLTLTFSPAIGVGSSVILSATAAQSAGVSFVKNKFRYTKHGTE